MCDTGYYMIGSEVVTCILNGFFVQWSARPTCKKECEIKPIDIVFIIDGSGSLGVHGFTQAINFVTDMVSRTHTYEGLRFARTELFTELHGMRPNFSHTAIVVTDGHSDNFNETVQQAQLLKDSGVSIYSVGVGLTNERELQLIASNDTYVFTVDNYDRIDEIAGPLARAACASTHGERSTI